MAAVLTDENDIVKDVALIPGLRLEIPLGWHLWFPVSERLPSRGSKFIPDFESQPWLKPETSNES